MNAARTGQPGPLPFHLASAVLCYQQALSMAPLAHTDQFPWHPDITSRPDVPPDGLATLAEALTRLREMTQGLKRWQSNPFKAPRTDRQVLWSLGSTRLLDCGSHGNTGLPVLVVPSLINRSYILDLMHGLSLMDALAEEGFRPILMDWGDPDPMTKSFGLSDYCEQRLIPALAVVEAISGGRKPAIFGYCMGGTLATGMAARLPDRLSALVTLGAPWDFHADHPGLSGQIRKAARASGASQLSTQIKTIEATFGQVPAEVFQSLFAVIDPLQALQKFRRFADPDPSCDDPERFVAIEDWLADGVGMTGPAALDLLVGWHIENRPATGRWQCLGSAVQAEDISTPSLVVTCARDTIVPPVMSDPLAAAIPDARHICADVGHVGAIVGRSAPDHVWSPITKFLLETAA